MKKIDRAFLILSSCIPAIGVVTAALIKTNSGIDPLITATLILAFTSIVVAIIIKC